MAAHVILTSACYLMGKTARAEEGCTCFNLTRLESGGEQTFSHLCSALFSFCQDTPFGQREERLIAPFEVAVQDGSPFLDSHSLETP